MPAIPRVGLLGADPAYGLLAGRPARHTQGLEGHRPDSYGNEATNAVPRYVIRLEE